MLLQISLLLSATRLLRRGCIVHRHAFNRKNSSCVVLLVSRSLDRHLGMYLSKLQSLFSGCLGPFDGPVGRNANDKTS